VSAVDAPPGVAFAGTAAGEFVSRRRAYRLAKVVCYYVLLLGVLTWVIAKRHFHQPGIEVLFAAPVLFIGIGLLGYAVRSARLRVDADGVRWGWGFYGFRLNSERITRAQVFRDAISLSSKRGSTWYLVNRDWQHFENVSRALRAADIHYERAHRKAPLRAKLQSFGIALDLLLIATAAGATFALSVAFAL
jgi:hypothetical protein